MSHEESQMRGVLDFSKPFDVALFDQVVATMYGQTNQPGLIGVAAKVLEEFRASPEAWKHADTILRNSQQDAAKYLALQTLDGTIQSAWHALPEMQRTGVRNFIINMIVELSGTSEGLATRRFLLQKLNHTLVQILKKDWPEKWPTFIQEIVASAKSSDTIMQNNLVIIRQLSEEIFDFSKGKMTASQIKVRKQAFNQEFGSIFNMLDFVFRTKQDPGLMCEALACLLACLSWIPLGYIFETKLVSILIEKFLPVPVTRNAACKCLTEIASLSIESYDPSAPKYREEMIRLLVSMVQVLKGVIPIVPGMTHEQAVVRYYQDHESVVFVQNYVQCFIALFKEHLMGVIEPDAANSEVTRAALQEAHRYLIGATHVDDKEMLKACVEYWSWLATAHVTLTDGRTAWDYTPWRRSLHEMTFIEARKAFISYMARPEEVILFEDENGEIVREVMKDVDAISHHNNMKEGLVSLTHLDCENTEGIMLARLDSISNAAVFQPGELATLCWAIGSISGAIVEAEETRFLIQVIKTLLTLCEAKQDQATKASIASDIMYVIGQYPRFLNSHWRFLKIVVWKLFEFMQETFPGVRDMACDTFLKISTSCSERFIEVHEEETPFVLDLLQNIGTHTRRLETKQVYIFYEATGVMIASAGIRQQETLVPLFMKAPTAEWTALMAEARQNQAMLQNTQVMEKVSHILKRFICGAVSVGDGFRGLIFEVFQDMMTLYAMYSQLISQEVTRHGEGAAQHSHVRCMRIVKKDIIKLLQEYCARSRAVEDIARTILPPLLDTVLTDYNSSVVKARDPQVISLMTVLVTGLEGLMNPHVMVVLDAILVVTLDMINTDKQDFPEHRSNLFKLLQALNRHCFESFLSALQRSPVIMDAIVSAVKDTKSNNAEIGLETLHTFLTIISQSQVAFDFFHVYFVNVLHTIFLVMTDLLHKNSFKSHCKILRLLIRTCVKMAEAGRTISPEQAPDSSAVVFLKDHLTKQLAQFPNLKPPQIQRFIGGLFSTYEDEKSFRQQVRDFLVELKEFAADDTLHLYEADAQPDELAQRKMQIPGMAPQPKARDLSHANFNEEEFN
eukprot:TRINITY_DN11873_c1_g4_i1.p1 TRINITY_DN11873_c1_g4~~TRINITY_DN11873_c1_g4_i1.p1  ORF type:complete len:1076 (+),score=411.04 TRINITY_DN11873_c1_g4_i1:196-3423(+)